MRGTLVAIIVLTGLVSFGGNMTARIGLEHHVKSTDVWFGGERTVFDFNGYDAWVVEPPTGTPAAEGRPWTWTIQWREAFVVRTGVPRLLTQGWHHVAIDTYKHRMDEQGLAVSKAFQDFLVRKLGLAPKCHLIGMSWGGFFSVRYAAHYPENVAKIFLDCPLLNLGGRSSNVGIGSWEESRPENWTDDPRMPVNMAKPLANAGIPILLSYGDADTVLDPKLNAELFIPRFKAAGGDLTVIRRPLHGHHPHGLELDDARIVDFFMGREVK